MTALAWEQPLLFAYEEPGPRLSVCARKRLALIEDVEEMLGAQRGWYEICQRLNTNPASLAKRLARYERHDLARPFWCAARNASPHRQDDAA